MKRKMMAAVGVAGLLSGLGLGPAALAQTQSGQPQASQPGGIIPMEQVLTQLKADGYSEFYEVERDGGRYEVKATNQQGRRVELYVDARTGETLKVETD